MALPQLNINKQKGGLGRALPGRDHYSGFLFYSNTLPSGFDANNRVKQIFSLEQAEDLGIVEGGLYDVYHYHISEYFRIQEKGVLWVGFYAVPAGTYDFSELQLIQDFANGEIRQMGVFTTLALAAAQVTALDLQVTASENANKPFKVLYAADISSITDLSTLPDLSTLTDPGVSVVIGQDGAARGAAIAVTLTKSVCALGTLLGAVSLAKVSESIAWVQKFPLSNGTELDVAGFGNGDLFRDKPESELESLNDKSYIFLRKFTDLSNTYFNDTHTAIAQNDDFSKIETNRTFDKAATTVRANVLPRLNSPVTVNADGSLTADVVVAYKNLVAQPLQEMVNNTELSQFQVIIDPLQDVISTSTIEVTVKMIPVGVAREITLNIGFATTITNA